MAEPLPLVLDTDRDRRRERRQLGIHLAEVFALLVGPLLAFVLFLMIVQYVDWWRTHPDVGDESAVHEATRAMP